MQIKEGANIRKSLLALVRCIRCLAEAYHGDGDPYIPYRDSKLTRILSPSLGRDCHTLIICTINPAEYKETLATLHFAHVSQQIKHGPRQVCAAGVDVMEAVACLWFGFIPASIHPTNNYKFSSDFCFFFSSDIYLFGFLVWLG